MSVLIIILSVLVIVFLLYIFAIRGRVGYTDFKNFKGVYYAHRGLFGGNVPENSLLAFQLANASGYGVEFDVHIMADGELAVIHDHSLLRTAGADVKIEDLTLKDLENYRLEGTDEKIPTLDSVLKIFNGEKPLIIELKSPPSQIDRLCRAVCEKLKSYKGDYCIESFDPRCVYWFKKYSPETIRGQLSENYFTNHKIKLPFLLKFIMTFLLTNFLTKPDFVSYRFKNRKHISNVLCKKLWKIQSVGWTIDEYVDLEKAISENVIAIFEKIKP